MDLIINGANLAIQAVLIAGGLTIAAAMLSLGIIKILSGR